jgi:hypothetical protein
MSQIKTRATFYSFIAKNTIFICQHLLICLHPRCFKMGDKNPAQEPKAYREGRFRPHEQHRYPFFYSFITRAIEN